MPTIRARIRYALDQSGLSISACERKANMARGSLSRILSGSRTEPSTDSLRRVAQTLGVYTSWLLGEQDYPMWLRDKAHGDPVELAEIRERLAKLEQKGSDPPSRPRLSVAPRRR